MAPALAQEKLYTIDDIYALPDGERAELIDGQIYYMAPPPLESTRKYCHFYMLPFTTISPEIRANVMYIPPHLPYF